MEETLLAFAPAILGLALAMALRLLRSRREAAGEIVKLQDKVAAIKRRNCELEVELALARQRATIASFHVKHQVNPPIFPIARRESPADSWRLTRSENEVDVALRRLHVIQTLLPPYGMVEEKYITEVEAIVERLGQVTGMNMSRWLGISQPAVTPGEPSPGLQTGVSRLGVQPRDRNAVRFTILSLLAFCNYQIHHSQSPRCFVPPPPGAARRIH